MFKWINKLKNKKGFTLIELIVVLAVLGIIALIAVPRFLVVQEQSRLSSDRSAAVGIQKAAEVYIAQADLTTFAGLKVSDLQDATVGLLDTNIEFQSADFENVALDTDISFVSSGGVLTVVVSGDGGAEIVYP